MNILVVIPARGGSKGIPLKNIFPLLGKPLLVYTLETVLAAELPNTDIVVSTDSEAIKNVALQFKGIDVVDRPKDLAGDCASTEDALLHAIQKLENKKHYDAVLTLQPTSPLRRVETLCTFIKAYEVNAYKYDALLSLTESRSDFWICKEGEYRRLNPEAPRRRQDRKPLYVENSAYYITDVESLKETHSILGKHPGGFVIPEIEGIDINEPVDLKIAELFLKDDYS